MGIENKFGQIPQESLRVVTNGPLKQEVLDQCGIRYPKDPQYLIAGKVGEDAVDKSRNIGVLAQVPHYSLTATIGKAIEVRKLLQEKGEYSKGQYFAVSDAVWRVGDTYINRPSADPEGKISGIKKIKDLLVKNDANPIINEATTLIFGNDEDGNEEITAYEFIINVGTINGGKLLDGQVLRKLSVNADKVAGGLTTTDAWQTGVVKVPEKLNIEVR